MDYIAKRIPPKSRKSAHYDLALYISVTDCGLLLEMGGSGGVWSHRQ